MSLVFERNKEATEYLINTILERDDLTVLEVVGQKEYKNPYFGGRVIKVDIYAKDSNKNDEDPIGRLVHDFGCVRSADMYNDILKRQVHYFKESEVRKKCVKSPISSFVKKQKIFVKKSIKLRISIADKQ